jgi:3-hydroxymyristoyl/3-hydroxydecanoyl-(acyl carrier protein) dehydratase
MSSETYTTLSARLAHLMGASSQRSSQAHDQFLTLRGGSLRQMQRLIELQMGGQLVEPNEQAAGFSARPALFDSLQLDEFGAGNFSGCFGPAFARYDRRNIPRIPNGDLKMMSRVVGIQGSLRDQRTPARIEVEYDVPVDAWYMRDCGGSEMPYSLLMEIALQPCGFLSAYLDTYALVAQESFYFRNLDGSARVVSSPDVRGKILTTRAQMLTSVVSGGTVIQKFGFSISCDGIDIYQGESTFGYFAPETMANQVGLDGGKPSLPAIKKEDHTSGWVQELRSWRTPAPLHLPGGRFGLLENVLLIPNGGNFGRGYVHAQRPVNPQDWFYPFHFSGDPVMPGSLGVEAVLEALKAYGLPFLPEPGLRGEQFSLPVGAPLSWRYRGQVTPQHILMELEIHLHTLEQSAAGLLLAGDASVWVDNLRIYEIKNAAVQITGQA